MACVMGLLTLVSWAQAPIEIVVHRGANALAPENTVASAYAALRHGATWVEVDVRASKDGVLYNLHDAAVDRTTNGHGLLADMMSTDADRLDVGSWFSPAYKGTCLPRISEMLDSLRGKCGVFFDVKRGTPVSTLVQLVREKGFAEKSFFWFGDEQMLREFVRLAPEMKIKVNASDIRRLKYWRRICRPSYVEIAPERITPRFLRYCHRRGIRVMAACQEDDVSQFQTVIDRGADLVNLDRPEIFWPMIRYTLPPHPDYSDTTQWYVSDRGSRVDVFYIISTETGDYPLPGGGTGHFADTYSDSLRAPMLGEMRGVDRLLSGQLNYYTPYYRQCSLQTFMHDSTTTARMPLAMQDVREAFSYYLGHYNQGRPFILAGFSQGAMIMLQLMKEMDTATYNRMVAAYALGVSISEEQLADNPRIVPATDADDTGVTICYNSVRDTSCALFDAGEYAVGINPVNWRTDSTPAVLMTEPTPLLPVGEQQKDTLTVSLDPQTHLLLVEGYTANDYALPLIGKEGNYHSREVWLYRDQLRENMARRAAVFLKE